MENGKKTIAFVYDAIYPYIKGGAEKRIFEIGRRLSQRGYNVRLYGMKFWKGPRCVRRHGMTICALCDARPLYGANGRRSVRQAIIFGLSCFKMTREKFDVIDCCAFPYFSLFFCRLAAWIRRKPLYATVHEVWGSDYWQTYLGKWPGRIAARIEKVCLNIPDVLIAVSDKTAADIKKILPAKKPIFTIFNGIDPEAAQNSPVSPLESDIISAGRMIAHKNIDVLLNVVCILKKNKSDILLFIVGDGPEKAKLVRLAAELGIEKNVRFFDFFEDPQDLYALMKSSKVFAFPSTREGFGIIVVEANACGLPVVVSDHPQNAAKDLIIDGLTGKVCLPDAPSLAAAIGAARKMGKNSAAYFANAEKYGWDRAANITEEIYRLRRQ